MGLEEIKKNIAKHKSFLKDKFKVKSISVFGSYQRGEQNKESDIDLLVEFHGIIDLFEFCDLEESLSKILGRKVDLVMKDTLKPRIKEGILREAALV
ncbi:MAG: putative nucleotidyltransferase [Candidatus Saganbacteria bacterium]|uniref:Putative nucleotidyltransferase n=1 Tax=Candidatus Saganbacteria bacterium TaxID=2575572 RepID=A0A833L315_UNCSA|nr:MAG: putative nucleotidyltransferase [Candidatus Saganbacteria bacterium]